MHTTSLILTLTSFFVTELPKADDTAIKVELFAENPQLVTPTGIAVDRTGRVFVAESNTHFRPQNYKGPAKDRILILEDTDGDGRADESTVFHEGYTHLMDLAFNSEGWLYVATRMNIHRMRDTNGDGKADEIQDVVIMETTGTYPHNGLSGLCFNSDGSMNFGLGENLGHDYTLVGSDGKRIRGGGEGGSTYHVNADGSKLRRVTTGWWNPFGMCVDRYGRIFGTDNDPGASPPCRLIQIHEQADYGYEYRYGRTGLHPLITWTGEMLGTIPMIAGTGEAPCGIIAAHRSNLPVKYRSNLLVASWADHQIERYVITQPKNSGQVKAERHTLVLGGNDFRPVSLATAPDGSIYVTDWVSASYQLHGLGRVWKIRGVDTDPIWPPRKAVESQSTQELRGIAATTTELPSRIQAVRELLKRGNSATKWAKENNPLPIRAVALPHLPLKDDIDLISDASEISDPLLQHAAITAIARDIYRRADQFKGPIAMSLLAAKRSPQRQKLEPTIAFDDVIKKNFDFDTWFVAVKWIADFKLLKHRNTLLKSLNSEDLTPRMYLILAAAIDRLDGKKPRDIPSPNELAAIALGDDRTIALRTTTMRLLNPGNGIISAHKLMQLTEDGNAAIRLEAIRLLTGSADGNDRLNQIAAEAESVSERLAAIAALASDNATNKQQLLKLVEHESDDVANAAFQSLVGLKLNVEETLAVATSSRERKSLSEAVKRAGGAKFVRPAAKETNAWLKLLDVDGDAVAGERVFFHSKVGTCSKCHQHGGRGTAVGPSLSLIAKRLPQDKTKAKQILLETILQPSKDMAPQYTPWIIVTTDGRKLTGLPRRKGGNSEAYLGINGKEFSVNKADIELHKESRTSIMPEGLLHNLTTKELRDLFAFLLSSK